MAQRQLKSTGPGAEPLRPVGPHGERTRRRLLEAAKTAFQERGYPATRVDDITRLAGTSHGAFYLYFSNKQDILEALAGETSQRMFALADELDGLEPGDEGYARIRKWIEAFVDAYAEHAPVVSAWIQAGDEPRFDQLGREVLETFAGKIAHAMPWDAEAAGGRRPLHPGITAVALVAMIERLCYFWVVRGGRFPPDVAIDTLAGIWYQSIFGPDRLQG